VRWAEYLAYMRQMGNMYTFWRKYLREGLVENLAADIIILKIILNNYHLNLNTVFSEIKKWKTKCLRKEENHTNALTLDLLDNSETIYRLKRYTVLTLPDRPE
jgi:hypothetical protein